MCEMGRMSGNHHRCVQKREKGRKPRKVPRVRPLNGSWCVRYKKKFYVKNCVVLMINTLVGSCLAHLGLIGPDVLEKANI